MEEQVKNRFEEYKEMKDKKKYKKRLWAHALKYKRYLILMVVSVLIVEAFAAALPLFLKEIIERAPELGNKEEFQFVIILFGGFLGFIILNIVASIIETYIMKIYEQTIEFDIKREIFNKIMKSEVKLFDELNEGYLMARMMGDSVTVAQYARTVPKNITKIVVVIPLNLVIIFTLGYEFGIISVVGLILIFLTSLYTKRNFQSYLALNKKVNDKMSAFLADSVGGIREIKSYTAETNWHGAFLELKKEWRASWIKYSWLWGNFTGVQQFSMGLLPIAFVLLGAYKIDNGSMQIATLSAIILYSSNITNPITNIIELFDVVIKGTVSMKRIYNFIDLPNENYIGEKLELKDSSIVVKNLRLKYDVGEHIINDVSFKIEPGEKIAFVGRTGSGKSTLFKALMKHYEYESGDIIIGGSSIKDVNVHSLRENITFMEQDPFISFDTIKNNIIFGQDGITDEQYNQAVKYAQAEEFINDFKEKEQTMVGPRGVTLSGGQCQRIALARAFLKNSQIILFDEATSALDNKTELQIKKAVDIISKGKTTLTIAHRLSTVRDADKIILLGDGKLLEMGTHKELMKKKGHFYKLSVANELGVTDE